MALEHRPGQLFQICPTIHFDSVNCGLMPVLVLNSGGLFSLPNARYCMLSVYCKSLAFDAFLLNLNFFISNNIVYINKVQYMSDVVVLVL